MQTLGDKTFNNQQPESLASEIAGFLNFLANPNTSIPLNSNFVIQFSVPEFVKSRIVEDWENGNNNWTTIQTKRDELLSIHDNSFLGKASAPVCLFANGILLPQENLSVARGDTQNGGIISGLISSNRTQQTPLKITFLETDASFIDFIIRPWIILTSHMGLIARGPNTTVKTDITAFFYSKRGDNGNVNIRKVYNFYGCAPVGINDSGYAKHDWGRSDVTVAGVDWAYNYYTVANLNNVNNQPTAQ
jgi:hypothetical protein